jgi:hypothetical protein
MFEKVLVKTDKFVVYETQSRAKPVNTIPDDRLQEEWVHTSVVRLTELPNDEAQIKALFDLFDLRKGMDFDACYHLVMFHDQGLIQYGDSACYAVRYDEPCRDFNYWIDVDHQGLEIEALDTFRLARGALEAFVYLEEQGYVLTQFDGSNVYAGSFSEDRACFFKIMFKGHKDKSAPTGPLVQHKGKFSPPETDTPNIYKSYSFTVGLMILYAIYSTHGKAAEFPTKIYSDHSKLKELIKNGVELCYKEGNGKAEHKDLCKVFLDDLLEVDVNKRRTAKELLSYKWIIESDKEDYAEYQREVEENEKAKAKEKEEEEKNKFN